MTAPHQRGAIMVITAWLEHGPPDWLVARISYTTGADPTARTHATARGADDIAEVVRSWLSELADAKS